MHVHARREPDFRRFSPVDDQRAQRSESVEGGQLRQVLRGTLEPGGDVSPGVHARDPEPGVLEGRLCPDRLGEVLSPPRKPALLARAPFSVYLHLFEDVLDYCKAGIFN